MDFPQSGPARDWLEEFSRGSLARAWRHLGCHEEDGGHVFRVWAPNARQVYLMGGFNGWDGQSHPLEPIGHGVWEGRFHGLRRYDSYQFSLRGRDGRAAAKSDPFAFHAETRPGGASKVYDLGGYRWGDGNWLAHRRKNLVYHGPLNIYEVHLGSWRRTGEGEFLSYRDIARYLVPYVKEMGFTHVELLPVTEHPLDGSWGYRPTGYFAATSRFGTPHDLMYLIDQLHQAGVGVIADWSIAAFSSAPFGLREFDGGPTYEHTDPRRGLAPDGEARMFDCGRGEVRSFLLSSALFWLEEYHFDGLRVDAVHSMLYLDYARPEGEWAPNLHGGRENLEGVEFFRLLNEAVFAAHPDVLMIAEDSTAWPRVTHPTSEGGLGFNLKWNAGWTGDTLHYLRLDPYFRQFSHSDLTFSMLYAFSENFILPLSHVEMTPARGSLISRPPGDDELKFAGLRVFYIYMLAHPGKKLLMMGSEFGQWNAWNSGQSLDWHLLEMDNADGARRRAFRAFVGAANSLYLEHPALWEEDFSPAGFQWLCHEDNQANCLAFLRQGARGGPLAILCNFSPVRRRGYRLGLPLRGRWQIILNSDDIRFGGSGLRDSTELAAQNLPCHGQMQSAEVDLPPMSALILRHIRSDFQENTPPAQTGAPELN